MEKWFEKTLDKVMKYNEYEKGAISVEVCDTLKRWTPCDLILREYLNNGGGSAKGFLGITPGECRKCYEYIKENKEEFISKNMISKNGKNNFGFPLWENYNF